MFKINNRNTRKRREICSKLKTLARHRSGAYILNFFLKIFDAFSSASIVDLEKVNVSWVFL